MFDIKLGQLFFDLDRSPTGEIWIDADGVAFPRVGWSDFALIVMDWFGLALLRIRGGSRLEIFDFMEGPYSVELRSLQDGILQISGKTGEKRQYEKFRQEANSDCVARLFTAKADYIIDVCMEHSWWSSDADSLKATTHALKISLTRSCRFTS